MRILSASLALAVPGCGAAPSPPVSTAPEASQPPQESSERPAPTTPTELVRLLESIATGAREGSLDDYVDHAFAERLPSGDELRELFLRVPDGCVPELDEGAGYAQVAIPPPMEDDTEEEAARIEAIIRDLSASTEVEASCTVTEEIEGEPVSREIVLYAIAVSRDASGTLRAMAWRSLQDEPTNY